ncbi:uncharacterized protein EV422DRAFT_411155 [Fimicolochytrium jonesii]|uniref:uncharacterized protein n=1 Tax=Fimicolochytrium jonesii TaxID=1396493 RepID=UPI0022FF0B4A|nr:uncharacterized protein EV422DRAFT_411155 [Fimicolochytrium jonesii]KAI8822713.1 hypothetical protein EV422DRAFT_411155 [Fimicolochytrium jonesii]
MTFQFSCRMTPSTSDGTGNFCVTNGTAGNVTWRQSSPILTVPRATLKPGQVWFDVQIQRDGRRASTTTSLSLVLRNTTTFITLSSSLAFATGNTYLPANTIVVDSAAVSNPAILGYNWTVTRYIGSTPLDIVQQATGSLLRLLASSLGVGSYSANVVAYALNDPSVNASSTTTFQIIDTLLAAVGCSLSRNAGQEITTVFAVQGCSTPSIGTLSFYYSVNGAAYSTPISNPASFTLPAGNVTVQVVNTLRQGSAQLLSTPLVLNATVASMAPLDASIVGSTFANLVSSSSDPTQAAAAVSAFTASLATVTDPTLRQSANQAVMLSMISTVSGDETAADAAVKTLIIAQLVSGGSGSAYATAVSETAKAAAAEAISSLAQVLAKTGATPDVLQQAAAAAISSVPALASAAGAQQLTKTLNLVGQALAGNLPPGETAELTAGDTRILVSPTTPDTVPSTVAVSRVSSTLRIRKRITASAASCSIGLGSTLGTALTNAGVRKDQKVVIQSTCSGSSAYPVDAQNLTARIGGASYT